MRCPHQVPLARVMLSLVVLALVPSVGRAQSAAPPPAAPAGTLQQPAKPQPPVPAKPPTPAPRQPVHHVPTHAAPAKHPPPVVRPQGPVHAHKQPAAEPAVTKPEEPVPPVMAPKPPAPPAEKQAEGDKSGTPALKVPRFASLRTDEVNMRAGPGTRYRIDWVYKRRDLPIEIERDFEVWRLVRDPDGVQGWVHQATLTGRRTFMVQGADAALRADQSDSASEVAILKVGVIGRFRSCDAGSAWCQVLVAGYRGYLRRDQVWGLLPDEVITP